ncbi:glycosyltransferase family 4 protein [Gammaproteobacteria bacterium]|nr:glycosyltransferase family 4 protein [Gammaproteobacteria bacterium]
MSSKKDFIIGIDASNIRHGGGVTHLSQFLDHAELDNIEVFIWSNEKTLQSIKDRAWLTKLSNNLLEGNFFKRTFWQLFQLRNSLEYHSCNLLFVPGSSFGTKFRPVVTMNQNLLPFELKEIMRYGLSINSLKFLFLRIIQGNSFINSDAIIYLSEYSKKVVEKNAHTGNIQSTIIPHGVEERFAMYPREQKDIKEYSKDNPFRIIYISSIDYYKHQWNVVEAVARLKKDGLNIALDLYGVGNKDPLIKLKKSMKKNDPRKEYIRYKEEIDFKEIESVYFSADLSIFASSCESFGQIVLESMAAGLPIACSNMSTMKEIVKDGALFFNPLEVDEIEDSLIKLINSPELRLDIALKAYNYSQDYSWKIASDRTFKFLENIIRDQE